jgi:hypothetical protein
LRAFDSQLNGAQQMTQKLNLLIHVRSNVAHQVSRQSCIPNDNKLVNVHYRPPLSEATQIWSTLIEVTTRLVYAYVYVYTCMCVHPHWNTVYYCILYLTHSLPVQHWKVGKGLGTRLPDTHTHTHRRVMLLTVSIPVHLFHEAPLNLTLSKTMLW